MGKKLTGGELKKLNANTSSDTSKLNRLANIQRRGFQKKWGRSSGNGNGNGGNGNKSTS